MLHRVSVSTTYMHTYTLIMAHNRNTHKYTNMANLYGTLKYMQEENSCMYFNMWFKITGSLAALAWLTIMILDTEKDNLISFSLCYWAFWWITEIFFSQFNLNCPPKHTHICTHCNYSDVHEGNVSLAAHYKPTHRKTKSVSHLNSRQHHSAHSPTMLTDRQTKAQKIICPLSSYESSWLSTSHKKLACFHIFAPIESFSKPSQLREWTFETFTGRRPVGVPHSSSRSSKFILFIKSSTGRTHGQGDFICFGGWFYLC